MQWNETGTSLTEAMVTIGIAGIISAIAALGVSRHFLDVSTTGQELVNDLRQARMQATRRGAHYQVSLESSAYQTERMSDGDGNGIWEPDKSAEMQSVTLPRHVSLGLEDSQQDAVIEFNSRGLMIGPDGELADQVVAILLTDSESGSTVRIRVWPSGQIETDKTSGGAPP